MTAESRRHWEKKELLAAQKEDHQTLSASERLASTSDFSWPEKRGGLLRLLHRAKPPEVTAHAFRLLPPPLRQAAIKALQKDTHASQQQKLSRWPGIGIFGKAWVETSKSLSNLALSASESRSTSTSTSSQEISRARRPHWAPA